MEDLGHIDINIKEAGGLGSGVPGGGPVSALNQAMANGPLQQAAVALRTQAQTLPSFGVLAASLKRTLTTGQVSRLGLAGGQTASAISSEIRDYIARPTLAGFSGLMSKTSSTGAAFAALGKTASGIVPMLTMGLAAVGVTVVAFKALQAVVETTKERIAEVGKYSLAVTLAQTQERVAELGRALREAEENGELYALAQRANTALADNWASVMRDLYKVTAGLSMAFTLFMNGLLMQVKLLLIPQRLMQWAIGSMSGKVMGLFNQGGTAAPSWMKSIFSGITTAVTEVLSFLRKIAVTLGIIEDNTGSKTVGKANEWLMRDLEAITGKKYVDIGRRPIR